MLPTRRDRSHIGGVVGELPILVHGGLWYGDSRSGQNLNNKILISGGAITHNVLTLVKENFPSTSYPTPVETFLTRSPLLSLLVSESVLTLPDK